MFATGMPFPVHGMDLGGQEFMALGAIGSLLSCKVDMGLCPNRLKLDTKKKKRQSDLDGIA
jgi:hypothetical protein